MPCGKEHVIVSGRNDASLVAEVWDALIVNNDPPRLFAYGDTICDVRSGRVRVFNTDLMGLSLARVVELERVTAKGTQPVAVPAPLERKLLVDPDPRLPMLTRVSRVPVLAADGSLREYRGYDVKTGVWYEPDVALPSAVPEKPSEEQVALSRDFVLRELLGDFPFEMESDRTGAFALFLLPFAREILGDAPTPLHLVQKPDVGAGATTLVQVCLTPGLGRTPASVNIGVSAEELEKVLLSIARAGGDSVFLDNVVTLNRQSPALAQAITSRAVEGRVLGISQMTSLPFSPIWTATGNNPDLTSELRRRTCPVHLAVWSERPWERGDWRHPDIVEYVQEEATRGMAAWAALCMLRGWLAAGAPGWVGAASSGFGRWANVVGGCVTWLGLGDFLVNRSRVIDAVEDRDDWAVVVALAASAVGVGVTFKTEDLHQRSLVGGVVLGMGSGVSNPVRALGNVLRRNAGRVIDGRTIVALEGHRPRVWVVRELQKRL